MPVPEAMAAKQKTQESHRELLVSLKYIPDDRLTWVPMGKAKTPLAMMAECAGAYVWGVAIVRNAPDANQLWEGAAAKEPTTREEAVAVFDRAWAEFAALLDSLTEGQLAEKRQVFWGEETVGNLLWMCYWHNVYHAGQLNYIQTLLGDTEFHHE